ncbi:hypothetical protein H5410_053075 [Solanum commersonii]|uniref:Uncharacterized protein n=1 Tax=Solanum commersonii TaxID=4109 RepID=A0A9J5X612_SOLCO|nr:hypothetical protein H5410_053075 [Solanum commersonii]
MPRLTEWKEMQLLSTGNDGRDRVGVRMFPGLEKLRISNCPLLKSILNQFEMLRELSIHGNQILEFGIEEMVVLGRDRVGTRMFPGLEKSRISSCPLLKSCMT